MKKTLQCSGFIIATVLGPLTGCASTDEIGVVTVQRLSVDEMQLTPIAAASQNDGEPSASGNTIDNAWYARHLQSRGACGAPFLVIEDPDAETAQIYFDGRCRR